MYIIHKMNNCKQNRAIFYHQTNDKKYNFDSKETNFGYI